MNTVILVSTCWDPVYLTDWNLKKTKMLQLVPGRKFRGNISYHYNVNRLKGICGWESNDKHGRHWWDNADNPPRDESEVGFSPQSYKPNPAVCLEVMWPGKEGERIGGEEQKAKVRPPPPLKSYLYSSGNTLYLHWGTHSSSDNQLEWLYHQLFSLFFCCRHWTVFHYLISCPVGVNLALFTGLPSNIGPLITRTCLAQGNWSLLSCLQFSIHLQLTFSQHSQPDWDLNRRFWSRGPSSATNLWGVTCSQSHARKLCSWPRRRSGWGHSQRAQVSSDRKCWDHDGDSMTI